MDQAARAKRFETLVEDLDHAYTLLVALLARLPIPMRLIERQEDDPVAAIRALSRAWELVDLQPLAGDPLAGHVRTMITDWLTAYELAVVCQQAGPALWRINGIELALTRFGASAGYVASRVA
jgi:hypothetical protein